MSKHHFSRTSTRCFHKGFLVSNKVTIIKSTPTDPLSWLKTFIKKDLMCENESYASEKYIYAHD